MTKSTIPLVIEELPAEWSGLPATYLQSEVAMSRKHGTKLAEAEDRADADQALADAEVSDRAPVEGEASGSPEANGTPEPARKRRGDIRYSVWGKPLTGGDWDYVTDQPTIGKVRRYILDVLPFARKTFSELKVTRTKALGVVSLSDGSVSKDWLDQYIK